MQYAKLNANVEDNLSDGELHSFLNITQHYLNMKS